MATTQTPKARRSYGTGALYEKADSAGRVAWYGKWRRDGVQVKRRIGEKRTDGSREGLTRVQAEGELRRLIAEVKTARVSGDALTITELGRRYQAHLVRQGRKKSTLVAVESILRIWLEPFFAERDLRRVKAQDVHDLISIMESGARPAARGKGDRRYGRPICTKTLRNYIGCLSALLGFAERKGWLPVNVARHVELPRETRSEEIHFLDPIEVLALGDAAIDGPYEAIDRALYLAAAMTGLRQGSSSRCAGATSTGPPAVSVSARTTCSGSSARRSPSDRRAASRWPTRSGVSSTGSTRRLVIRPTGSWCSLTRTPVGL